MGAYAWVATVLSFLKPSGDSGSVKKRHIAAAISALLLCALIVLSSPCAFIAHSGKEYSTCVVDVSQGIFPWLKAKEGGWFDG